MSVYVGRDKDGVLSAHIIPPMRQRDRWDAFLSSNGSFRIPVTWELFKVFEDLKWEDDPVQVEVEMFVHKIDKDEWRKV